MIPDNLLKEKKNFILSMKFNNQLWSHMRRLSMSNLYWLIADKLISEFFSKQFCIIQFYECQKLSRTVVLWNRYGHVVALRRKSSQKSETACWASEQLEVANMVIKRVLYVIRVYSNRFQVDTGSTSGFAQKTLLRIFKYNMRFLYAIRIWRNRSVIGFLYTQFFFEKMRFLHRKIYFSGFLLCIFFVKNAIFLPFLLIKKADNTSHVFIYLKILNKVFYVKPEVLPVSTWNLFDYTRMT